MAEGDGRVIAAFSDYNELINALRLCAAELNLSGEAIDAVSGLPSRYAGKLLGPNQVRRLGAISLGPFLGALAVRGLLVEDSVALEKLRRQTTPRRNEYERRHVCNAAPRFYGGDRSLMRNCAVQQLDPGATT